MARHKELALTKQRIFSILRENPLLLERYSVRKIGLFGSLAAGRQTAKSDVDLLVEFEQPTYDNFLGLSRAIENLLGRKVEIVTPDGLAGIRVKEVAESIRKALAYG